MQYEEYMNTAIRNINIFFQFFHRDILVYIQQWKRLAINNWFLIPSLEAICFGYIVPMVNMSNPTPQAMTAFYAGTILWIMFPLAWGFAVEMMYDFENDRFINYLNRIYNPNFVVLEKILFYACACFINTLPFFPISMLLLGDKFDTTHLHWPKLILILFVGALFCAAYNVFFICYISGMENVSNFWLRVNFPMINLGGVFLSWKAMASYSPMFGYALYLNPLIYLSEGMRNALQGPANHFPYLVSLLGLSGFTITLTLMAMHFYKKKLDTV